MTSAQIFKMSDTKNNPCDDFSHLVSQIWEEGCSYLLLFQSSCKLYKDLAKIMAKWVMPFWPV